MYITIYIYTYKTVYMYSSPLKIELAWDPAIRDRRVRKVIRTTFFVMENDH